MTEKTTGGDNALGRRALNAVRIVSDSTPTTILTASADSGLVAAIMLEMECVAGDGRRLTAAFFWDDARRFAEALLVIVHDAEERDRERVRQRQEADDAE